MESEAGDRDRTGRRLVLSALAVALAAAVLVGSASAGSGGAVAVNAVEGNPFAGTVATYTSSVTADQRFVEQAFLDLLGRDAGQAELTAFGTFLGNGGTRTQVAQALLGSDEARAAIVGSAYTKFLRRAAAPVEVTAGVALLKAGATDEQLKALVLGSNEYLATQGGGTVEGFLAALYADVLGRPIDPAAAAAFAQAIGAGATRQDVALDVLTSLEARQGLVTGTFERLLGRAPSPSELQFFAGLLGNGGTDEQVSSAIVGSAEYGGDVPASFATATIAWGDGSPVSTGSVAAGAVTGAHTYADEGVFPITVVVRDLDGDVTIEGGAAVADAALSASPRTFTVAKKTAFTLTVATFSDANPLASASEFTASIDWGDSRVSAGRVGALEGGVFAVVGSHAYAKKGSYPVTVEVHDEGGSSARAVGSATVTK